MGDGNNVGFQGKPTLFEFCRFAEVNGDGNNVGFQGKPTLFEFCRFAKINLLTWSGILWRREQCRLPGEAYIVRVLSVRQNEFTDLGWNSVGDGNNVGFQGKPTLFEFCRLAKMNLLTWAGILWETGTL